MAQNTFDKLVNNLSATEKSTLLSKLLKYTDDSVNEEVQSRSTVKTDKSKTKEFAQKEFEKFSLIKKIFVYILSFLKNSTVEDEVIESELVEFKKELSTKCNRFFDVPQKKIKSAVLEKIFPVVMGIEHLKGIYPKLFEDRILFFQFIEYLLENERKTEMTELKGIIDLKSLESNDKILEKHEYNSEKEKRIKHFFLKVAKIDMSNLNFDVSKLNILIKYLDYDFSYLPNIFGVSNLEDISTGLHELFVTEEIIAYFKRLNSLLATLDVSILSSRTYKNFLLFLREINKETPSPTGSDIDVTEFDESVHNVMDSLEDLRSSLLLESTIKVFSKDIFYSGRPLEVSISVVDMYKIYKMPMIDKEWTKNFTNIREKSIRHQISKIYNDYNFDSLSYFNKDLIDRLELHSNAKVKDFYSLNILKKFLESSYHEKLYPTITKIVLEGVFTKDLIKNNFVSAYYTLKSGIGKITEFDDKFKDEAPMQRKINNAIIKTSTDNAFKSILINLLIDINDETQKLKNELIEAIKMLGTIFNSIVNPPENTGKQKILTNLDMLKIPVHGGNPLIACDIANSEIEHFLNILKLTEETF
jgi:hypothetical protein